MSTGAPGAIVLSPFPLPLRNALAEIAIAALDDEAAGAALRWLAAATPDLPSEAAARLDHAHLIDVGSGALLPVHAPHGEAVRVHAARGLRAAGAFREGPAAPGDPVGGALARAAALWNEGLFFEVHEVLEDVWKDERGDVRAALQGAIQVAVAFHHLAHGNTRGGRTLLREGRARLAVTGSALPLLDTPALLAATAIWEDALRSTGLAPAEPPPRLPLRAA